MNKSNTNEFGLTLVELLVAIALTSLIFTFATSILVKGMNHYKTISMETVLRDEADFIMAKFYRELYTLKETEIEKLAQDNKISEDVYRDNYILYKEKTLPNNSKVKYRTGFIDQKIYYENEEYKFQNNKIRLNTDTHKSTIKKTSDGIYEIKLVLYMEEKNKFMEFSTEISTVNDKISEEGN